MRLKLLYVLCKFAGLSLASSTLAHEFWIEPLSYSLTEGASVEANIRVGQFFEGPQYPFIPNGYFKAYYRAGEERERLPFTGADNPALSLPALEPGLHVIVLQSEFRMLKHKDGAIFLDYLGGISQVRLRDEHADLRNQSEPVTETYARNAKTLVSIGGPYGTDVPSGLPLEWVALDNPYDVPPGSPVRFQLLDKGVPAAEAPVQVFARPIDGPSRTEPVTFVTDAEGKFTLPEHFSGEIMINSVKVSKVSPGGGANTGVDWISQWSSITFARSAPP